MSALRRKNRVASSSSTAGLTNTASSLTHSVASSTTSVASGLEGVSVLSSTSTDTSYKSTVVLREKTGRTMDKARRRMSSVFTSDSARKKWRDFERKVSQLI